MPSTYAVSAIGDISFAAKSSGAIFALISATPSANPTQYNKLVSALSAGVTLFEVEVSTTGEYGSKTDTYEVKVTSDGLNIRVEGIELGDTSIIF